jgi:hypothetical protein
MIIRIASSRDETRAAIQLAFFLEQHFGLFQAAAALRLGAQRSVDFFRTALGLMRGPAQLALADSIADTHVHGARISLPAFC